MVTRPGGADWVALRDAFLQAQAQPSLQNYRRKRWLLSDKFAGWIADVTLPSLSMEQALCLYAAAGGRHREVFKSNSILEIRETLDFLLYDTVKLEGRFHECSAEGGAYKLAGAGKEFISYLLCVKDPMLFAVWNSNAERTLKKLRIQQAVLNQGPLGICYLDLLEALAQVRRLARAVKFPRGGPVGLCSNARRPARSEIMPWRDILIVLRDEMAQVRAERRRQAAEAEAESRRIRQDLSHISDSLEISGLLYEMNATLLEGKGNIETVVSWESDRDQPEADGDGNDLELESENPHDEEDLITTVLSTQQGTSLQVNGVDIRPERDALEQALVEAFRDELEV